MPTPKLTSRMIRLTRPSGLARARRRAQRGVSLLFSMMTLVALSLTAVALIRSVDTGSTVLGNLSFKQDTLLAADEASREAVAWLDARKVGSTLYSDLLDADGYSARLITNLDPTGVRTTDATRAVIDWDRNGCRTVSGAWATCIRPLDQPLQLTTGNATVRARWLIQRVCNSTGDPTGATIACAKPLTSTLAADTDKGDKNYSNPGLQQVVLAQYFRIIVRATGGRNTSSVTETLVHF
jgi:type IV pilus assembly protein PilX